MTAINAETAELGRQVHERVRPALEHFIKIIGSDDKNKIHNKMHRDFRIFSTSLATLNRAEKMPEMSPAEGVILLDHFRQDMVAIMNHTYRPTFIRLFQDKPEEQLIALHGLRYSLQKAVGAIEMFQHRHQLEMFRHQSLAETPATWSR